MLSLPQQGQSRKSQVNSENSLKEINSSQLQLKSWTKVVRISPEIPTSGPNPQPNPIIFATPKNNNDVFSRGFDTPISKDASLSQLSKRPGHVPVLSHFHKTSYRPRLDDKDNEDLDGIITVKRKKQDEHPARGKSVMYDSIFSTKGEFMFPFRTYRPKVHVGTTVPAGKTPQAVVAERLYRQYRKFDIPAGLKTAGIEFLDLLPPSNYGEDNERFYQESMWRNRSKISGIEKRAFLIRNTNKMIEELEEEMEGEGDEEEEEDTEHEDGSSSDSAASLTSKSSFDLETGESVSFSDPFHLKSPFGHQFPLEYFDDEEFDIRSPADWMSLREDPNNPKKIYPLPGKAYLPMPGEAIDSKYGSISEMTYSVLLTQSTRLENFRRWLIKQRYRRYVVNGGQPLTEELSEAIIKCLTRAGPGGTEVCGSKRSIMNMKIKEEEKVESVDNVIEVQSSSKIENSDSDSSDEAIEEDAELIEIRSSENFLSQFKKKEVKVDTDPLDTHDLNPGDGDLEVDEGDESENEKEMDEEEYEMLEESLKVLESVGMDLNSNVDIDPFEKGYETVIYDYDKMKKVHIYDWSWVDVAIFDYGPDKNKYLVRSINKPFIYAWVGKIYLCFDGEDPEVHVNRMKRAVSRRNYSEAVIRYNLYIDCLPKGPITPKFPEKLLHAIEKKACGESHLEYTKSHLELCKKEIILDYQRTHLNLSFDFFIDSHHKQYKTWIREENPDDELNSMSYEASVNWRSVSEIFAQCSTRSFLYKRTRIMRESVIYKIEPYKALSDVIGACVRAKNIPLISTRAHKPQYLNEYILAQVEQMKKVKQHLQEDWEGEIVITINENLGKIRRSWYNTEESDWNVYEVSKVAKFLNLVRFIMQDTLKSMVVESVRAYVEEVKDLTEVCEGVTKTFEWNGDLKTSLFPPPEGMTPVWLLELGITEKGPIFLDLLRDFPRTLTKLINTSIEYSCGLPDITALIMKNLLFGSDATLYSVEKGDPIIVGLKKELFKYLKRALLPVDIYAQKYRFYMPVAGLNIEKFLEEWNSKEHSTEEIAETVESHMKHYSEMEAEIPIMIDIGAFRIDVEPVRKCILDKKKALQFAILDSFAAKLRNLILDIRKEYDDIEQKLLNRSDDIEEVMELKAFLTNVPDIIKRNEKIIETVFKDYEMFDKFRYVISLEDFESKWLAAMGTKKMYRFSEEANVWLDDDYDRLLRIQQAALADLSDSVDQATLSVAGLAAFIDLDKAIAVKLEVQKVYKMVVELLEQSALLNRRQALFGFNPVQKEAIERITNDIEPYKNLWYFASDWLTSIDVIYNQPLVNIDVAYVEEMITQGIHTSKECIKVFEGAETIQWVAQEILFQIETFQPLLPLIKTFKNPALRQRHIERISEICEFPLDLGSELTFKELIDQGVGNFVIQINKVNDDANQELEIEKGMEKMGKEMGNFLFALDKDSKFGVPVIIFPKGAENFVKLSIRIVEGFLSSEFKTPFEVVLLEWEKKVRLTNENFKLLKQIQSQWMKFQDLVNDPEISTNMPPVFKIFGTLQRIWRRIIRIVKGAPIVINSGSDSSMKTSLHQFDGLLRNVRDLLDGNTKVPAPSSADFKSSSGATLKTSSSES